MKEDLTEYNDNELSLRVFNDEGLYLQRHHIGFIDLIKEYFNFTSIQLKELQNDLYEDLKKH